MAKRLGALMWPAIVAGAIVLAALAYLVLLRSSSASPRLVSSEPVAMAGNGSSAVAVADDGTILVWLPPPEEGSLPGLPLESPPERERVEGPVLQQVRERKMTSPGVQDVEARIRRYRAASQPSR